MMTSRQRLVPAILLLLVLYVSLSQSRQSFDLSMKGPNTQPTRHRHRQSAPSTVVAMKTRVPLIQRGELADSGSGPDKPIDIVRSRRAALINSKPNQHKRFRRSSEVQPNFLPMRPIDGDRSSFRQLGRPVNLNEEDDFDLMDESFPAHGYHSVDSGKSDKYERLLDIIEYLVKSHKEVKRSRLDDDELGAGGEYALGRLEKKGDWENVNMHAWG